VTRVHRQVWAAGALLTSAALAPAFANPTPWFESTLWKDRHVWSGEPAEGDAAPAEEPLNVVFSSVEIGSSLYVNSGFKRALGASLDEDGFFLMGTMGTGRRGERLVDEWGRYKVDHLDSDASLLAGYQWKTERAVLSVYLGFEGRYNQAQVGGAFIAEPSWQAGLRAMAEVWAHPTEATLATATLIVGTAPLHLWARHSYGWQVWDGAYTGPELVVSLEEEYREARVGAHLTGFKLGAFTVNVSGGLLLRDRHQPSGYVGLTTHFKL